MARVYADINATLGESWYDYDKFNIDWSPPERYEIVRRVGGGKYSEVFEGVDMVNHEQCVIKVLKPVAAKKIKREIKVLRNLTGGPNVVALLDVVLDSSCRYHSLIMEYVENIEWKQLYPRLTESDIKHYTFQLLKALDFVHSHGIMHRDVKPGNVMVDYQHRKLRLIDWGLAEFYHPGTDYHIRVGSRYYKAPELLVGYKQYDYSLDMWSVGCMFASMIFRREHFFRGTDNNDQLLRILKTLGTEQFDIYLRRYGVHFETDFEALLTNYAKLPWSRFITADNQPQASAEALDLLDHLLKYDHRERLTAREAQGHVYFNSVRLEAASTKVESVNDSGFSST
ncbi:Casein kinase II subunit alpha [Hypsizygus marmoreus]|uniref:Casein kinase II subunit alpha n=1 Tax=Hypsizygus marmoreus TaxID=39966 RepID=A0A369JUG3_HYPMA|nr:Casein kinase II subunit alpha [Hypsizygus marmoreus]